MQKSVIVMIIVFLIAIIAAAVGVIFGGSAIISNSKNDTILISKDRGETWGKAENLGRMAIKEFYLSKFFPGRIYVSTNKGILVGEGGGNEWEELPVSALKKGGITHNIAENGKEELYISVFQDKQGSLIKYSLKGGGEHNIYFIPLSGYGIFGVAADAYNEKNLRLVSSDGGFYESLNGGFTWRAIKRFREGILQLIPDNNYTGRYWIRTSRGKIFETFDNGRSWNDVSLNLDKFDGSRKIENLVFDQNSGFLYLASDYGLLRSQGGNDWAPVPLLVPPEALPIKAAAADPKNSNIIYAGTKNQFYKSFDGGQSWNISHLPTDREIARIIVDSLNSDIIYVGLE